jgi:hypothetical protein
MIVNADKSLLQSKILWSSMASAGLSTLAATLTAPDDVPSVVLKLLSAGAAMASVAAATFRAMDQANARGKADATREHKEMP